MDERMKNLVIDNGNDDGDDSFAQRAENYYQKRPQLIALLKDLYNGYTTLLNRNESMKRKSSSTSMILNNNCLEQDEVDYSEITSLQFDSDLESSFSYHHQQIDHSAAIAIPRIAINADNDQFVVVELVGKIVENEVLSNHIVNVEKVCDESERKVDLLRKLVEVLESERVILLTENTKLGFRVSSLLEENRGLASDVVFMKMKAAELARCALRLSEDHRVYMLSRKIEDLQGQIYGLEKRNKEYYEMLISKEMNEKRIYGGDDYGFGCFQLEKFKLSTKKRNKEDVAAAPASERNNGGKKWWGKVVKMDMFMCGLNST
ncbi:hypothetical protein ACFE04_009748 [Oxalis oulophora]